MPENEHNAQDKTENVVYPGRLGEYHRLRSVAETSEFENEGNQLAAEIAAQLAGLAYILDGIRFAARNPQ